MNRLRKIALGGGLIAAAALGGAAGGSLLGGVANADTTSTTAAATAPAASSSTSASSTQPSIPAHGTAEHEGQEKAVTGDNATKAQASAVQSVGGGTAGAVTSDFTGSGYEVTVTKTDGTQVEVHLDSSFNVAQGHGAGGHAGNDNDADDQPATSA